MYSGNLGAGHDFDTILGALQQVPEALRPDFLIIGSGKREPVIRDAVKQYNLDKDIRIEAPVPLGQLFDNLLRGDIHLVSQRPGTAGLIVPSKVYSLLACGRPIVFIGPPECEVAEMVQKSQCGYVVAPGDRETACRRIQELCRDSNLRKKLGEQARAYYDARLGRDTSLLQFAELLEGQGRNQGPGSSS